MLTLLFTNNITDVHILCSCEQSNRSNTLYNVILNIILTEVVQHMWYNNISNRITMATYENLSRKTFFDLSVPCEGVHCKLQKNV